MNILLASSEVAPFSKTGGLADVAGALPLAVAALGHSVIVVSPRYSELKSQVKDTGKRIKVPTGDGEKAAEIFEGVLPAAGGVEVPAIFIGNDEYYDRDELYNTIEGDYDDNNLRFAFFARALLEAAREIDFKPDVLHLNDWQSALAAVYLRAAMKDDPFFASAKILLTIHNLGYQGIFGPETIEKVGLPSSVFDVDKLEFFGNVNYLKGGVVFADAINTVSRKYAQEIQTEEYGVGLDDILRKRSDRLFGILNGVDYAVWNPETDKLIAANYSIENISGKEVCKKDLLEVFGLPFEPGKAVVGMVSRLAEQKGFDIIESALDDVMTRDMQLVILGTGEKRYHDFFEAVKNTYPGKLGVQLAYDDAVAHKIEAGSDMFLMPSQYEPCGLNQMYSLKYGAVPVVRGTGGLDDTISEWDAKGNGNGFKFYDYNEHAMTECLDRALKTYLDKPAWKKIVANGMAEDHSWDASARRYIELYNDMLSR